MHGNVYVYSIEAGHADKKQEQDEKNMPGCSIMFNRTACKRLFPISVIKYEVTSEITAQLSGKIGCRSVYPSKQKAQKTAVNRS